MRSTDAVPAICHVLFGLGCSRSRELIGFGSRRTAAVTDGLTPPGVHRESGTEHPLRKDVLEASSGGSCQGRKYSDVHVSPRGWPCCFDRLG